MHPPVQIISILKLCIGKNTNNDDMDWTCKVEYITY